MIPLWALKAAAVALVLAVLAASLHLYGKSRYEAGERAERALWTERESREVAAANTRILELTDQARAIEAANATALAGVATRYEQEKRRVIDQTQTDLAAVRAGTLVLRDPGTPAACQSPGPGRASPATAAAPIGDGQARAELPQPSAPILSERATEFLIGLTNDADAVVEQLIAAQAVILAQQAACGRPSQ